VCRRYFSGGSREDHELITKSNELITAVFARSPLCYPR
jgi:hypothetical protein